MDYQGLIWVADEDVSTAIEATVSVEANGDLSIISGGDRLGSWQPDQITVEPQGESGYLLVVESDRIMFRPATPADHLSFGRATAGPSSLSDRIRASAAVPRPPSTPPTTPVSERPQDSSSMPSSKSPTEKESSSKVVRNLIIVIVLVVGFGYLATLVFHTNTYSILGTFTLYDTDLGGSSSNCYGTGGYSDITAGLAVTVRSGDGTVIATGNLGTGTGGSTYCDFLLAVGDVPKEDFYSIEVGHRGELTYSFDEMVRRDWTVALTLGQQ